MCFHEMEKTGSSRKDISEIGRKSFPLARKSVSTSQNKGFVVKINLHYAEKSFNWQEYLKTEKKIGFHQPENSFPLARMKDLFQKYISNV